MEREINLGFFWKCLKKCWIFMVLAAIVAAAVAGTFAAFVIPKKYSSNVNFYIKNSNAEQGVVTSQYVDVSDQLINDYVELIKSDVVLSQIKTELGRVDDNGEAIYDSKAKDLSISALRSTITASSKERTSHFTIKVTHYNAKIAYHISLAIRDVAPRAVTNIAKDSAKTTQAYAANIAATILEMKKNPEKYEVYMQGGNNKEVLTAQIEELLRENNYGVDISQSCFLSTNTPIEDGKADSPNIPKISILSAAASAIIVYIIFFVIGLSEMNVSTEEDLRKHITVPVIGIIPSWETSKQIKK